MSHKTNVQESHDLNITDFLIIRITVSILKDNIYTRFKNNISAFQSKQNNNKFNRF